MRRLAFAAAILLGCWLTESQSWAQEIYVGVGGTVSAETNGGGGVGSAAVGGVAAGWSPYWLPSLQEFYRGDLGKTIATGVSTWADQGPTANNCTQGTGSKQPTQTTIGTMAALGFASASSQQLNCASLFPNQPNTVFVVGQSTSGATQQEFFGDSGHNNTGYWSSATWNMFAGSVLASANATQNAPLAFAFTFNTTTSALYINSSTVAAASGTAGTNNPATAQAVGSQAGPSNFLNGKIGEIAISALVLDVYWRGRKFTYDSNRYGIASQ